MTRVRLHIRNALALCLSLALPAAAIGADEAEIKVVKVAKGIAMLQGPGGNIGASYGPDGVFLIDDKFAPLADKILAAIASLNPERPSFVLNTHWHADHTGGNESMSGAGAVIVAHDKVRERMSADHVDTVRGRTTKAAAPGALPVVTFGDDVSFHLNGNTIHAVHVGPAHTDGDSVVYFSPANVVHTGDVYFNGIYPFIDVSSGGNPLGVLAAVDQILTRIDDETRVIPGHGPLSGKSELSAYREMLGTVCERVAELIDAGKSLEEVVAANPTAEFDARWGGGFLPPEKFTRILYQGLRSGGR